MKKEVSDFQVKYGKAVLRFGFSQIPNILIRNKKRLGLTSSELIVLLYLLSYYREPFQPIAYPSLKALSKNTGLSSATVHRAKRELEKKEFVRITKPSKPNKYCTNYYDFTCLRTKLESFAKHLITREMVDGKINEEKFSELIGDQTISASMDFLTIPV